MKKAAMVAGILFLLVFIAPAFGQFWRPVAEVKVPFEFTIGNTALPEGTYLVQTDPQTHLILLLNKERNISAVSLAHDILPKPSAIAGSSKLIFVYVGQRYVLHQVVVSGDNHMHDLIHAAEIAEPTRTPST